MYMNLCTACSYGIKDWLEVQRLVEAGAPVNNDGYDYKGANTPLMMSIENRAGLPIIKLLLNAGSNVHTRNSAGRTALVFAARQWRKHNDLGDMLDVVQALLKKGSDVNVQTKNGFTALMFAAEKCVGVVQALLAAGAGVHEVNKSEHTALMLAAMRGSLDVVNALLAAGSNVHAQDWQGRTAMMLAAEFNDEFNNAVDVVKALLNAGSNIHAKDKKGKTARKTDTCRRSKNEVLFGLSTIFDIEE